MRDKNVPYYLLIHTNSYTGNFERELIGYCFGVLPKDCENFAREYKKAFWNYIGASDIDSLEEYIDFTTEYYNISNKLEILETLLKNIENYNSKINNFKETVKTSEILEKDKLLKLYSDYLYYSIQNVDDRKENTFFNIENFYRNEEYNCDTICIQLKEPLDKYLEDIIIPRIKEFFENDIFNIIEDYRWVCEFGNKRNLTEKLELIDLELVNSSNEIIKKYV